jgi:hypothetical protein
VGDRLGELFIKARLITKAQLAEAMETQRLEGGRLQTIITRQGFCSDSDLVAYWLKRCAVSAVDLDQWPTIEPSVLALIPGDLAIKHRALPLQRSGDVLTLVMSDPTDLFALDDIAFLTGCTIEPMVSSELALDHAFEKYFVNTPDSPFRDKTAIQASANSIQQADLPTPETAWSSARSLPGAENGQAVSGNQVEQLCLPSPDASPESLRLWLGDLLWAMTQSSVPVELKITPTHAGPADMNLFVNGQAVAQGPLRQASFPWLLSKIKKLALLQAAEHRVPQLGTFSMQGHSNVVRVETIPSESESGLPLESIRLTNEAGG